MDNNNTNNVNNQEVKSSNVIDSVNKVRDSKKWRMTIIIILIVVAIIMYLW